VRRQAVLDWLIFLKANRPDYRDINICPDRLSQYGSDSDATEDLPYMIDDSIEEAIPSATEGTPGPTAPQNGLDALESVSSSESMVLNLNNGLINKLNHRRQAALARIPATGRPWLTKLSMR
jgi:hypothetical protein